jgi:hypothetical protein
VAWILIVVASVVALGAAMDVWVKRQALDTNWTAATADMFQNDQIRGALSLYVVNELYDNVDVQAALQQRLPSRRGDAVTR